MSTIPTPATGGTGGLPPMVSDDERTAEGGCGVEKGGSPLLLTLCTEAPLPERRGGAFRSGLPKSILDLDGMARRGGGPENKASAETLFSPSGGFAAGMKVVIVTGFAYESRLGNG